jgi:hypothetical protein
MDEPLKKKKKNKDEPLATVKEEDWKSGRG